MKIAILYICTGEYVVFWKEFYQSFELKFLPQIQKEYFVFTDAEQLYGESLGDTPANNIHKIYQENLDWPGNTLFRFKIFATITDKLKEFDYIFFANANLVCIEEVTETILPMREDLLVVQHPGFFDKPPYRFPYDRHKESKAYIPYDKGSVYVCGGVNGGKAEAYIHLITELHNRVEDDYARGVIAEWHDESQLNKYILEHTNYKMLPPSYCYPQGWKIPYRQIMMVRDKSEYINVHEIKKRKKYNLSWYNLKDKIICLQYNVRRLGRYNHKC